jgi:ABC-type branched-subunit amino acid transport system substrate-binding protein
MRRALAIGLFALAAATAPGAPIANNDVTSGRRIFGRGGAAGEVVATFAGTNTSLPPRLRRCAGCHGPDGLGTREGGVEIPPISWMTLTAPRDASPGRPGRPGYDEAALARALAEGVDPAGRSLALGMPRFQLTPAQITALFDYLRIVGTERDLDPGIAADEIRVGALLPLSGARAAWGRAMRTGLENALAAAGPIYGRRLRLVAADAGDDVAAALRGLAASDQVFALVATMLPVDVDEAEDTDVMPMIGPLVPTTAQRAVNQFYLLAPIEDQMRVLVDELAGETPHSLRLVIIGPEGSVADAVADQATRNGATVVRRIHAEDLTAALPPAVESAPDAVLALPGVDLDHLVAQLADRRGDWLLAGPAEAVTLDGATDERLRLVLPVLPADPRGRDSAAAMATPPLAAAAAAVLVEGLKRMGARASRAGLIAAIETLRYFPTGVLPPLSFGQGQHRGNHASVVIRPDRKYGMIVLGGWRAPR